MPFDERTDWRDTPSAPPPPGSTPVHASDILRWERGIAEAHEELGGKLSKVDADATYVRPPAMRASAARLTAPNSISATALNLVQGTVMQFPFPVKRWRIWFRNMSLRSATAPTNPTQVTGVFTGLPLYESGNSSGQRWMGAAAADLTQRSGPLTVPTNGSKVWTPWIANDPFDKGGDKLIRWGTISENTGTGVAGGNSYLGMQAPNSANAAQAAPASITMSKSALYLDVGIEYELDAPAQIVVVVGDSNGLGYSQGKYAAPASLTNVPPSVLPYESWPMMAGAMAGASVINLSVGSATPGDYAVTNQHIWDCIPAGAVVDAVICPIGINGVGGGLNGFSPHMRTINAKARTDLNCDRIFWCTLPPAGYTTLFGRLTAAAAAGATALTMDTSPAVGTIMVGSGHATEDVTVASVSGAGPYTVTLSAGLAYAHAAQEPVSWGNERTRRMINQLLRQMPDGINGTVDFEKLLESAPDSALGDPRFLDSDLLHWNRGAAGIRAQAMAPLLSQPKYAERG